MSSAEGVIVDPLYVAVTRPPMKGGVTYAAFLVNVLITVQVFLVTQNLLWLGLFAPLHGLCWLLCQVEPRIFDLALLWGRTRGPGLLGNVWHWRANSYSPLALRAARSAGGDARCVLPFCAVRREPGR
jgi:type IV secretion system protein VirB3